jgi:hypothetical protein
MGLFPVAGIVKRKGDPGRTPKILAPLICGAGPGLGVRMSASSADKKDPAIMDKKTSVENPKDKRRWTVFISLPPFSQLGSHTTGSVLNWAVTDFEDHQEMKLA